MLKMVIYLGLTSP